MLQIDNRLTDQFQRNFQKIGTSLFAAHDKVNVVDAYALYSVLPKEFIAAIESWIAHPDDPTMLIRRVIPEAIRSKFMNRNTDQTLIPYSGGLESSLIALSHFGARKLRFDRIHELHHELHIPRIEPLIILFAAYMGYKNVILGNEYSKLEDMVDADYVFHPEYNSTLGSLLGITISTPFMWLDKFRLFEQALRLGIDFHSCNERESEDHSYCGACFKCFQYATFKRALGQREEFTMNRDEVDRILCEIDEYYRGEDKRYATCCSTFEPANAHSMQVWGMNIRDLWGS